MVRSPPPAPGGLEDQAELVAHPLLPDHLVERARPQCGLHRPLVPQDRLLQRQPLLGLIPRSGGEVDRLRRGAGGGRFEVVERDLLDAVGRPVTVRESEDAR